MSSPSVHLSNSASSWRIRDAPSRPRASSSRWRVFSSSAGSGSMVRWPPRQHKLCYRCVSPVSAGIAEMAIDPPLLQTFPRLERGGRGHWGLRDVYALPSGRLPLSRLPRGDAHQTGQREGDDGKEDRRICSFIQGLFTRGMGRDLV